jgi:hypothetical protein
MERSLNLKTMLYKIPYSFAVLFQLVLLTLVFVFHLLVLCGWIPYALVWGGKLSSHSEMLAFEGISIAVNTLLFISIVVHKSSRSKHVVFKIARVIVFLFSGLFVLNTVWNLFAEMQLETFLFTLITFLSALFCLRIALEKKQVEK